MIFSHASACPDSIVKHPLPCFPKCLIPETLTEHVQVSMRGGTSGREGSWQLTASAAPRLRAFIQQGGENLRLLSDGAVRALSEAFSAYQEAASHASWRHKRAGFTHHTPGRGGWHGRRAPQSIFAHRLRWPLVARPPAVLMAALGGRSATRTGPTVREASGRSRCLLDSAARTTLP